MLLSRLTRLPIVVQKTIVKEPNQRNLFFFFEVTILANYLLYSLGSRPSEKLEKASGRYAGMEAYRVEFLIIS